MKNNQTVTLDENLLEYLLECGKNGIHPTIDDIAKWKSARDFRDMQDKRTRYKNELQKQCDEQAQRNIYDIRPKDIVGARIVDEERFRKLAWFNTATQNWQISGGDTADEDWFSAKFRNGVCIELLCTSHEGMCSYNFDQFFDHREIENRFDLEMQTVMFDKWMTLFTEHILESDKLDIPTA